jgi:hypothetical protein
VSFADHNVCTTLIKVAFEGVHNCMPLTWLLKPAASLHCPPAATASHTTAAAQQHAESCKERQSLPAALLRRVPPVILCMVMGNAQQFQLVM